MTIYERALSYLEDGDTVGLGSGRAASAFIELLGRRIQSGLKIRGVPTSHASEELARHVGIPLVPLAEALPLAVTIDGADEVDPNLDLIKGYGRALVREKIIAVASKRRVILVGRNKLVDQLGARGKLPIEVVPFALPLVEMRLRDLGLSPALWRQDGKMVLTDNHNAILDLALPAVPDPKGLHQKISCIPGVVDTGYFFNLANVVLVGDEDNQFELIEERLRRI